MRTERGDWGLSRLARRASKSERQRLLQQLVREDPLLTDQTRPASSTSACRRSGWTGWSSARPRRGRGRAGGRKRVQGRVKSLGPAEVAGDLIDLELGRGEASRFSKPPKRWPLPRQGSSVDTTSLLKATRWRWRSSTWKVALTGSARLAFHRPVRVGDRVVAKATVKRVIGNKSIVRVESRVDGEKVFSATLTIFALDQQDLEARKAGASERVECAEWGE